ncbi:hypothetical protein LTR95_004106 [Oleoguttula sp. CCFEE 5521]
MAQSQRPDFYEPLATSEIRIFNISGFKPAPAELRKSRENPFDVVEGWLEVITLDEVESRKDEFAALSYCWGSHFKSWSRWARSGSTDPESENDDDAYLIKCNTTIMRVRSNLHSALCNIARRDDAPKALWIDALCINQSDSREKSAQVSMMGRIYSAVGLVIAWLGPSEPNNDMSPLFPFLQDYSWPHEYWPNSAVRDCFSDLESRDYFDRAWTFQELCVARRAVVQIGDNSIEWSTLVAQWSIVTNAAINDTHHVWVRLQEIKKAQLARHPSLLFLLRSIWARCSSDPRDKVYAVLGLYGKNARLVADYTLTVRQVFVRASKAIIEDDNSLDILHYACIAHLSRPPKWSTESISGSRRLPLWVPDWGDGGMNFSLPQKSFEHLKRMEFPSIDPAFVFDVRLDGEVLIAAGIALGRLLQFDDPDDASFDRTAVMIVPFPECAFAATNMANHQRLIDTLRRRPSQASACKVRMQGFLKAVNIHDAHGCSCVSATDWRSETPRSENDYGDHVRLKYPLENGHSRPLDWVVIPSGARTSMILRPDNRLKPSPLQLDEKRASRYYRGPSQETVFDSGSTLSTFMLVGAEDSEGGKERLQIHRGFATGGKRLGCLSGVYGDFELR